MSKNTSVQGQKQVEQPTMAGEEDSAVVRRWWEFFFKKGMLLVVECWTTESNRLREATKNVYCCIAIYDILVEL
jgi:hypothetical protein